MKKIRYILIGCGNIGTRHAEHINRLGELTAVCDIDKEKAKSLSEKYNVPYFLNMKDLFSGNIPADVVSVCTPNGLHKDHTVMSLRAGYHVLCEKPMALNSYDCGIMINEAEHTNKRLFVVKQNRYNLPVIHLKKLIQEDKLGRIFNIQVNCYWNRREDYYKKSDWKGSRKYDGGVLYTQFSHFIDLLYWMFGEVKEVHSYIENYNHLYTEIDDSGVAILKFVNEAVCTLNYSINSYNKNWEGSLSVIAEKGTVKIGGKYLNEIAYQNIEDYDLLTPETVEKPNDYGNYEGSMSNHDQVYNNVNDVLLKGAAITTSNYEGLKAVEIIEKIYKNDINDFFGSRK